MIQKLSGGYFLVVGNATKNAELRHVGDNGYALTSFSVAAGKREDTTTIFVNCKAWRRLGEYAGGIQKGDAVLCVGKENTHEYNGKQYTDLICDFVDYVGAGSVGVPPAVSLADPGAGFTELPEDDSDLPF